MELTKAKAIELLNKSIPYPEQMTNFDLDQDGAIYFTWRGERYKFDIKYYSVMLSKGCMLEGSNSTLLMERLLKSNLYNVINP